MRTRSERAIVLTAVSITVACAWLRASAPEGWGLRPFRTGSALPPLEDLVPALAAVRPQAPDLVVLRLEESGGPVADGVGILAAEDGLEP